MALALDISQMFGALIKAREEGRLTLGVGTTVEAGLTGDQRFYQVAARLPATVQPDGVDGFDIIIDDTSITVAAP